MPELVVAPHDGDANPSVCEEHRDHLFARVGLGHPRVEEYTHNTSWSRSPTHRNWFDDVPNARSATTVFNDLGHAPDVPWGGGLRG